MTTLDYDVIVAGGGVAGMTTAISVAKHSNQNLTVLVIDRNPRSELGKKTTSGWSCGDATSTRSIEYVSKNLGISYGSPEIEHRVKRVVCFSPDHETGVNFEGPGCILNRKLLPQRQMRDAEKLGVQFKFQWQIESLIADDAYVVGVEGRDMENAAVFRKTAKVVVDATGISSRLRRFLPIKSFVQSEINRVEDVVAIRRKIITFDIGKDDPSFFDSDSAIIHFDPENAPGGYKWVFPKGTSKANVGIGLCQKLLERRNRRLQSKDTLQGLTEQYIAENPVIRRPKLAAGPDDDGNAENSWQASVRRHNDCMVANGYIGVGDAMWKPRAIDAGGISNAIYGAIIAGRVIVEAIEANDRSERGLWKYNKEYNDLVGYEAASFEVLRRLLQTLTNEDLNYGMKNFLRPEDVANIVDREHPKFNGVNPWNPAVWSKILHKPGLARSLRFTVEKSHRLREHYGHYPSTPDGFPEWHRKLVTEMNEAHERFPIS